MKTSVCQKRHLFRCKIFKCIIYGMLFLMSLLVLSAVTGATVSTGIRVNIQYVYKKYAEKYGHFLFERDQILTYTQLQ